MSRTRPCAIGALLGVLVMAGCNTPHAGRDPLVGEIHPQSPTLYGSAPPPGAKDVQPTKTSGGVPGIPSTQGPYSNAALASMDGGRGPLAINDPLVSTSGFTPNTSTGPTVIPLPRDPAAGPSNGNTSFDANAQPSDILQAQLRARGVLWQKQETVPDGIRFTCIVPNRVHSESSKIYEATARDLVTAVQAIIVQIDHQ